MARQYFRDENPVGNHFRFTGEDATGDVEIVGVVKDAKYSSLREAPSPVFYVSYRQAAEQRALHFYVRTSADTEAVAPLVRRAVSSLGPNLPVRDLKTMRQQIDENVAAERLLSALTVSFAGMATMLAAIGLYGVLAYDVARRTREIGIRMALGARLAQVRGLVMRQVGLTLSIGTVIGLGAAAAAGRVLQASLFGATPWDPVVYASAVAVVVLMAFAAAYLPARRASRVDPMVALRDE